MAYTTSWLRSLLQLVTLLVCYLRISAQQQPPEPAAQNGDVRLNQYGEFESTSAGVLQVYLNSVWMPVCYDNFTDGAAAAACRQLGYCTFDDDENYRLVPKEDFPEHNISYTCICNTSDSCPSVKDYTEDGQLHLLRCSGQTQQVQCAPVYLYCKECELRQYNGRVYLSDNGDSRHFKSTGTLYLNYNKRELPVCADPFNKFAADSACRQLGYTGAAKFNKLQENQVSWGLNDCRSQSHACLSECTSSKFNRISSCVNVFITCTFDPNQSNLPSGSSEVCTIDEGKGSMCEGHVLECATSYPILGLIILAEFFVLLICIWKKFHRRRAADELSMPALPDDPPNDLNDQQGERQPLLPN